MEAIVLPAGTLVKVDGLPFGLLHDTPVDGNKANLPLIRQEPMIRQEMSFGEDVVLTPHQPATSDTTSPSPECMNALS